MDINALLAEFLGTFIFVSVILITGNPYMICLTLLIVILLASSLSGGHINPAVSTATQQPLPDRPAAAEAEHWTSSQRYRRYQASYKHVEPQP